MVNTQKLIFLAKKEGMELKLVLKRGNIWDFDVSGGNINRLKIVRNKTGANANIYYGESSKSGIGFKREEDLINFIREYN